MQHCRPSPGCGSRGTLHGSVEGEIAQLSLTELVQMICMGMHDREIHVFEGNVEVGAITLRRGQLERCFAFGMWGEQAFFKLLALRAGRYVVRAIEAQATEGALLGKYTWQELLMESARLQDESARPQMASGGGVVIPLHRGTPPSKSGDWIELDLSDEPPSTASPIPNLTPLAPAVVVRGAPEEAEFSRTMQDATTAYLRRDFEHAARLLERCLELRPNDKRTLQNLERINRRRSPK